MPWIDKGLQFVIPCSTSVYTLYAEGISMLTTRLLLLLMLVSAHLCDQSITGTILGTVYDASKSVVANAKITATNTAQGWNRATTSDELGNYIFSQLPPGPYKIDVNVTGFQAFSVTGIELLVDQRAR